MFFLLGLRRNHWPVTGYGAAFYNQWRAARCQPLFYEDLPFRRRLEPGVYIFADLELLNPEEREEALRGYELLRQDPARHRLWNHPTRSWGRYQILQHRSETGRNDFRVFRLEEEWPADLRYPVFLRHEILHLGAYTELLYNADEVRGARAALCRLVPANAPLLLVEHLDCASPEGIHRKYGVLRLGERYLPMHMIVSRNWVTKDSELDLWNEALLAEEIFFLENNPHREEVHDLFERAGIDYGRMDYSVVNGRVQVFEINTHPSLFSPGTQLYRPRQRLKEEIRNRYFACLAAQDPQPRISLRHGCTWLARGLWRERVKPRIKALGRRVLPKGA